MGQPLKTPCHTYQRRRPENTPLYKVIQLEINTFISERQAEGRPLPDHVINEFQAYLKCGLPQYGFLRLKCSQCDQEKIVAFSCKKRGFCPGCAGKRMAETAAHLVDNVLPFIPYRQFVLSYPIPLRYWINTNKKLAASLHKIIIKQIHGYYINKAKELGIKNPMPGSISFTQRFGSDLRLNPHHHILCPDGVYTMVAGKPLFKKITSITDQDVATLVEAISELIRKHLVKKGYLDKDGEVALNPTIDDLFADHDSLNQATARSLEGRIAFGKHAGQYVTRIGPGFGYDEEIPLAKGRLCYSINGFSLHCATNIKTNQRDKLERLIRYIARGPIANKRLEITEDGKHVTLKLKTPYRDGTSHLKFTFSELIEKLVALIPPPRSHLVKWAGCLAPASKTRKDITLKPEVKKGFQFTENDEDNKLTKNYSWSKMLARVFKVDVATCDQCGSDMKVMAAIKSRDGIQRYLRHLGLDTDPPAPAPPKANQQSFDFESQAPYDDELPSITYQ